MATAGTNFEAAMRCGPYTVLEEIGTGGMGSVFRAWDERLQRPVAVKMLHPAVSGVGMRERFLREARAASALHHPNVCTVFDIGEEDGRPYLVMELLEGETAKARLRRGPLPVGELLRYAQDVAGGLAAAHGRGILHRDVKPANLFLGETAGGGRQAKILDFGLAKSLGGGEHETSYGLTAGTAAYMSPEQARGEPLDGRSDLFSLGVSLYEMATGQTPFRGTTSALVFVDLLSDRAAEPVRNWNAAVPVEVDALIRRLLRKERERRYGSAAEVLEALREAGRVGPARLGGGAGEGSWTRGVGAVPPKWNTYVSDGGAAEIMREDAGRWWAGWRRRGLRG